MKRNQRLIRILDLSMKHKKQYRPRTHEHTGIESGYIIYERTQDKTHLIFI